MDTADYFACSAEIDGSAWERERQSYNADGEVLPDDEDDEDWWCLMCGDWTDAPCGRCGRCGELAIAPKHNHN